MPLSPRYAPGVRTPVIPFVAFASVPTTLASPKQAINCVPFVCRRLGIREL